MGNAAARPISSQECAKYGITMADVNDFNNVVNEAKKRKKNKKLEKKDIDNIHRYCKSKKRGSKNSHNSKQLDKLIEDRLSLADPSVTMSTTESCSNDMSSSAYTRGDLPSMIRVNEADEEPSVLGNDYSVVLNSAEA